MIFCDLDGTLILNDGTVNLRLIEWLEAQKSPKVIWSARGAGAIFTAQDRHPELLRINALKIGKPTVMIDNNVINWIRYVKVITNNRELK